MTKKFLTIILMTILTVSVFAQDNEMAEDINKSRVLTEKEITFKEKVLDKKKIDIANGDAMKQLFKRYIGAGVSLVVVGSIFDWAGLSIMASCLGTMYSYGDRSWLDDYGPILSWAILYVGAIAGPILWLIGAIITPLCAIPFIRAGRSASVYRKSTGNFI